MSSLLGLQIAEPLQWTKHSVRALWNYTLYVGDLVRRCCLLALTQFRTIYTGLNQLWLLSQRYSWIPTPAMLVQILVGAARPVASQTWLVMLYLASITDEKGQLNPALAYKAQLARQFAETRKAAKDAQMETVEALARFFPDYMVHGYVENAHG